MKRICGPELKAISVPSALTSMVKGYLAAVLLSAVAFIALLSFETYRYLPDALFITYPPPSTASIVTDLLLSSIVMELSLMVTADVLLTASMVSRLPSRMTLPSS